MQRHLEQSKFEYPSRSIRSCHLTSIYHKSRTVSSQDSKYSMFVMTLTLQAKKYDFSNSFFSKKRVKIQTFLKTPTKHRLQTSHYLTLRLTPYDVQSCNVKLSTVARCSKANHKIQNLPPRAGRQSCAIPPHSRCRR